MKHFAVLEFGFVEGTLKCGGLMEGEVMMDGKVRRVEHFAVLILLVLELGPSEG